MDQTKQLVTALFKSNHIQIPDERMHLFDQFLTDDQNRETINTLIQNGNQLMAKWKQEERIADIMQQPVRIPNATVGKPYEANLDFEQLAWKDVTELQVEGLEDIGLQYDAASRRISGVPTKSGDIKIKLLFKVEGQPTEAPFREKGSILIINPDPKSLWKNLESDKADPFWKEDNVTVFEPLGDRHILVSSKRGRSHANVGSFREDDFAFKELANGWCLVVVSDGAGSAKLSRKGSALACQDVVEHFSDQAAAESMADFDDLLKQHLESPGDATLKSLNRFVYNHLGKAAFRVYKKLEGFAAQEGVSLKDLSATLIFTLFKKYESGYALLSFGVGDCPIGVLNREQTEVTLMNWLDVGEFGGGTRFITMREIFQNEKFATRFGFKYMDDFSYLVLMSDGIYDPKFVVEADLARIEKWQEFLADLQGNNADGVSVELRANNEAIVEQFSKWMDFWSPGNHDDRTLAIVF
jgi:serine/threonine protein phosphatase PrpC